MEWIYICKVRFFNTVCSVDGCWLIFIFSLDLGRWVGRYLAYLSRSLFHIPYYGFGGGRERWKGGRGREGEERRSKEDGKYC